jgi:hypothetical protein
VRSNELDNDVEDEGAMLLTAEDVSRAILAWAEKVAKSAEVIALSLCSNSNNVVILRNLSCSYSSPISQSTMMTSKWLTE